MKTPASSGNTPPEPTLPDKTITDTAAQLTTELPENTEKKGLKKANDTNAKKAKAGVKNVAGTNRKKDRKDKKKTTKKDKKKNKKGAK